MKTILFFLMILSGSGFVSAVDFKKEDRVVLLGNTFFEREIFFSINYETIISFLISIF